MICYRFFYRVSISVHSSSTVFKTSRLDIFSNRPLSCVFLRLHVSGALNISLFFIYAFYLCAFRIVFIVCGTIGRDSIKIKETDVTISHYG